MEQGADRDKPCNYGVTPLHAAAICGSLKMAKMLMRYGAELDARNKAGQLPIDVARNEAIIRQAILDERRRRSDHTFKRIREEDLQPAKDQRGVAGEGEGAAVDEEEDEDENEDDDEEDEDGDGDEG